MLMSQTSALSVPEAALPVTPARSHGRGWLRFVLVGAPLLAIALFAAGLMWQHGGTAPLGLQRLIVLTAFVCVAAAGPVAFALLLRRLGDPLPALASSRAARRLSPLAAYVVLTLAVAVSAVVLYRLASSSVERAAEQRLRTVATLKQALVQTWLDDVLGDVRLAAQSPTLARMLQDWQRAPGDSDTRARLVGHLQWLSRTMHYVEVSLHDATTGAMLLAVAGRDDSPAVRRQAVAARTARGPILEDLHANAAPATDNALHIGAFCTVPLPDSAQQVVMHVGVDPRRKLFPLIGQWPGSVEAAEVLLLRPDATGMVVLNDNHVTEGSWPARRLATTASDGLAAALARGESGALQGIDDRNQAVLAYAVPVPATRWWVLAKLDQAEAFSELNRMTLVAAWVVGALLLAGTWWWVDHRRRALVEQRYQMERAELSHRIVSVQEQERRRWSSELHDRTGANLAAINLNLKAIAKAMPQRSSEDDALVEETAALLSDTVASIREFCNTLRPAILEYSGLVPALQGLIAQIQRRTGLRIRFEHSTFSGRYGDECELMLFRIAQEALINCTKHARARQIIATLEGDERRLRLSIEDDGVGFDPPSIAAAGSGIGHGLLNMRERAAFVGGLLTVETAPGRGTRVTVTLEPASGLPTVAGAVG
jgi:signal transduction histidine kinase